MRKIVLLCAAGMSTSMLVTKMKKYAESEGYDCEINAHAVSEAKQYGAEADIVLLGPQDVYKRQILIGRLISRSVRLKRNAIIW